jgi:glycosyltransferase involved in cell wall biosynthesis
VKVDLYPADHGGCGHYRMIWPAAAVNAGDFGIEATICSTTDDRPNLPAIFQHQHDGTHVVGIDWSARDNWPDVMVFQRPLNRLIVEAMFQIKRKGIAVVVELDDDFRHLDPKHVIYNSVQPHLSPDRNWRVLQQACEIADVLTVSTPYLAKAYGKQGNAVVIRNYVPASYLELPVSTMPYGLRFVWSGSLDSHPFDLQTTRGAIARGLSEDSSMNVIGHHQGVKEALQLTIDPGVHPPTMMIDYAPALAKYDCMLVPLDLTPFNQAKSYLKGLEAAACGLEVIASPTDQYLELERMGLCRTVKKPQHWTAAMKRVESIMTRFSREVYAEEQRDAVRRHGLIMEERASERVLAWRKALSRVNMRAYA